MKSLTSQDAYLNLFDINEKGTTTLGPGLRYCIWVQGCPFNCSECATPDSIPFVAKKLTLISSIIQSICNNNQITGITISGGEPFMQASKLHLLLKGVHAIRPDLDVIIYTGFKKKDLIWPEAAGLLAHIDVLIDGLYVKRLDDGKGLRGSSNQTVHFLTEKLKPFSSLFVSSSRRVEALIQNDKTVFVGIPNHQITSLKY